MPHHQSHHQSNPNPNRNPPQQAFHMPFGAGFAQSQQQQQQQQPQQQPASTNYPNPYRPAQGSHPNRETNHIHPSPFGAGNVPSPSSFQSFNNQPGFLPQFSNPSGYPSQAAAGYPGYHQQQPGFVPSQSSHQAISSHMQLQQNSQNYYSSIHQSAQYGGRPSYANPFPVSQHQANVMRAPYPVQPHHHQSVQYPAVNPAPYPGNQIHSIKYTGYHTSPGLVPVNTTGNYLSAHSLVPNKVCFAYLFFVLTCECGFRNIKLKETFKDKRQTSS